ncbi:MAG: HEAT repeat domain-containing protein, partial [Planctomycetota bacterium]
MRSIIKHKSCTIISCTIVLLFIIAGCPSKDKDDQKSEETPTVRKQKIESAVKEKTQLNTELVEAISKNKYGIADSNGDNVDSNITAEHLYKGQRQSPTGSAKEQGQALPGSVNETSDLAGGNLDVIEPDLSQDLDSSKAISEIKHALNDKDAQIREDAVNRLVDVDHPSVATLVIKALGDISEDVRT